MIEMIFIDLFEKKVVLTQFFTSKTHLKEAELNPLVKS